MNTHTLLLGEKFFLLQFTPTVTGDVTKLAQTILQDVDIETALIDAKKFALAELALHPKGTLLGTEFGYDLLEDSRVFSRYWVHPKVNTGTALLIKEEI